jgi:hydrogenase expression/formation protein HypE
MALELESIELQPVLERDVLASKLTDPQGIVAKVTGFGGTRIVDMLAGEQLPRIC